jgi:hypothetical protein
MTSQEVAEQVAKKLSASLKKKQKLKKPVEIGKYLVADPDVCFGKRSFEEAYRFA